MQVGRAAVVAFARNPVLRVASGVGGVRRELLAHHRARGALGQAEVDADLHAALEAVAVRQALVAHAAEVPRLVREDGDRAGRLRERLLSVLDPDLVERVADRRRHVGLVAADEGKPVRVLDEADVLAARVAADLRGVPGDQRGFLREEGLGARAGFRVDRVPPVRPRRVEEDARDESDHSHRLGDVDPVEARRWRRGEGGGRVVVPPGPAAEVREVARLGAAVGGPRGCSSAPRAQVAAQQELDLEPERGEEEQPDRDHRPHVVGDEEVRDHEGEHGDPGPPEDARSPVQRGRRILAHKKRR